MYSDISLYVRSCDACQRMGPGPKYRTNLHRPLADLFTTFSIDFAGQFPVSRTGLRYILVCVEHLTSWPVAIATESDTAEVVVDFVREKVICPFGPPGTIVSDNSPCFWAAALRDFMKGNGISWKTVLAYAPMSNGRAERMVGTIKKSVARVVAAGNTDWEQSLPRALYGYRLRPLSGGFAPFELLYSTKPRLIPTELYGAVSPPSEGGRHVEILYIQATRADRVSRQMLKAISSTESPSVSFSPGDLVMIAFGESLTSIVKWTDFKSRYYGPCRFIKENNPRFILLSKHGRHTRVAVRARFLVKYQERPAHLQ